MMMQPHRPLIMHTRPPQRRISIIILIHSIHLLLGIIQMVEQNPNQASSNETRDRDTDVHPLDSGVVQDGVQRLGDGAAEGVGEEEHGLHKGLH